MMASAALLLGPQPGAQAAKPAVGRLVAQPTTADGRRGIVVVGVVRGRRLGLQYARGCKRLRLRGDRRQGVATVVPRNRKRCTKQRVRRGRLRAWVCIGRRCDRRRIRISPFRDSDGDGLGDLYERAILHASPHNPTEPGSEPPPKEPLSPLAQLGCVANAVNVSSAGDLLDQVAAGNDVCVTAPVGDVRIESLGDRAGVTISSKDSEGLIDQLTVQATTNLTVQGARLHSIEIRRADGTQVLSSVIGGTKSERIEDQLIFMPESSSDVTIESNDIGWTVADNSGNTGYGCRCYGTLNNLHFVGNKLHDLAADGFQGVEGENVLIDRNEIGPVGANPSSDEHSDNIQITGNGPNLRITNNWIHHQGYFEGAVTYNAGSTYIHGGSNGSLLYENNLIETAQGRTEICGLGTGGTSRSNITIRRNTWVDGGEAFDNFPGFEWDCDSGVGNTVERNIAVDPDGGFAQDGSASAAAFSSNLWGQPSLVTLDADGNCTSPNCNPTGQEAIGYRKPAGVHW